MKTNVSEPLLKCRNALIISISFGLILGVTLLVIDSRGRKEMAAQAANTDAFVVSDSYNNENTAISYDAKRQQLRLTTRDSSGSFVSRVVGSEDIVEVSLYDSGSLVAQTGGAVAGAIVGGVGLGLVGKKKNKMTVDVGLHIVVRDPERPSWTINFAQMGETRADLGEFVRGSGMASARHWYGIVASLADSAADTATDKLGDAAQLKELADLHEKGLLSEEEFHSAKKRLLGLN